MMVRLCSYFVFFVFSTTFYSGTHTLTDGENLSNDIWDRRDLSQTLHDSTPLENRIPDDGNVDGRKWPNVLTFNRLQNLTETDKGPGNVSKVIFINSEDHLAIFKNDDDDDDETGMRERDEASFALTSPERFLYQIHSSEGKGLERSKRQAENGKRKCRCRRKGRRVVRRRRRRRRRGRRRRVGQTRPVRRRRRGRRRGARRRRGRRRCVCRRKGGGGEDDGEGRGEGGKEGGEEGEGGEGGGEGEEEGGEGEEEGEEGGEEGEEEGGEGGEEGEEGDKEGEGGEESGEGGEEGDDEGEEEEGGEEDEDSEDDEGSDEESDEKEDPEPPKKEMPATGGHPSVVHDTRYPVTGTVPVYVAQYPGVPGGYVPPQMAAAGAPVYTNMPVPFSPYPYYTGSQLTVPGKPSNLAKA